MENTILEEQKRGNIPHILLHSCCAPCSTHCIKTLTPFFHITILYYNPNIEPREEYEKRKQEEIRFINEFPHEHTLDIVDTDYDNTLYHARVKGLEKCPEGGERCFACYTLRLSKTAQLAKKLGYDYFGTTLTISPLKDSQILNQIGKSLEKEYEVPFLYSDFKKKNGYYESIQMAKEYGLYRQDYCGCVYSKIEREEQKKKASKS